MYYYIVNEQIIVQAIPMDRNYYNYSELTEQQTAFYLANPTASVSEVLAMELEPPPEPVEPTEPEPTIEEQIAEIQQKIAEQEEALELLILSVAGA